MLEFQSIHDSRLVRVSSYRCRACRGGPTAEEHSDSHTIVLMRQGVFCRHFGRRVVASDVNQAAFFSRDSMYRVSHPGDCGDRGTVLSLAPRTLHDMVRELDPSIDDHPEAPFPFAAGPCDSRAFWRHRQLVAALESARSDPPNSLWVDETAMHLVADVLKAAFERHGMPKQRQRPRTEADHRDLVEAAKAYIASRLGERVALDDVACAVQASPFHLARVFRRRTGMPVHRYLMGLRLRTALERLAAGANDLTTLALELGFSSHSHFTDAFRRALGRSPSAIRRDLHRRSLGEMSKNLEV